MPVASVLSMAVIGAGPAGLTSAKNALEQGFNVTVFEMGSVLGGTWVYTDETGKDKYGVDIHSAMYKGLRTNTPFHLMEFRDHHYPIDTTSYPNHKMVLKYLESYADRFELRKCIRFNHLVVNVLSLKNNKWNVIVNDVRNKKIKSQIFDAVFVCINKFSSPNIPQLNGANEFKGKIMHSHDYRKAEDFRGEDILIIGAGSSGIDLLINHLSKVVNRITLSTRTKRNMTEQVIKIQNGYEKIVTLKNGVAHFTPNGVKFIDGSQQNFTIVIYATGYKNVYPFLNTDTGIHVESNYVQPLYKQIINIEHPTMAFIGLTLLSQSNPIFELQARFALKFISGAKKLPSKADMMEDMQNYAEKLWKNGYPKQKTHVVGGDRYKEYWTGIANTADIEMFPEVYVNLFLDAINSYLYNPFEFRKYKYTVIDDKTFTKEKEEQK